MNKAPVVAIARHRIQTDGQGVTTLVCFLGCPLRCRYCLNPFTLEANTPHSLLTPEALYEKTKMDALYFEATGGGITFGGGEPLLRAEFIREFRKICGNSWHLTAETSLAIPREQLEIAAECIDEFLIDIKDTDPSVYRAYTGRENALVLENLQWLLSKIPPERIIARIPLIPDYNTPAHQQKSKALLQEMGVRRVDLFDYVIKKSDP